jgi:hypothetical protein
MRQPTRQEEFLQVHPLIRPVDFYGRYFKVSLGREDNGNQNNGEFIASGATSGEVKEESPVPKDGTLSQAAAYRSCAVQPPATALGSLSSVALSSGPAEDSVPTETNSVNSPERVAP